MIRDKVVCEFKKKLSYLMNAGLKIFSMGNFAGMIMLCAVFCLPALTACYEDDFGTTISQENNYSNSGEILPLPGNSGMISASDITDDGLNLTWARATDEKTPQSELEYRIYRSDSSNIGSPDTTELNGTPLADWTADATSISVSGLEGGKVYYFNVLVKAQDGRKAAYTMVAATTVGVVYMFSAYGTRTGNLTTLFSASARTDVDKICSPALSPVAMSVSVAIPAVKNIRAFISISADDAIKNFPARYGIPANWPLKSFSGNQIAWTWADMLDGSINMKLEAAGIASTFWWSGSASDGSFDSSNNCSGWTERISEFQGMAGAHNLLSEEWLARDARNCNNSLQVLCVGW